MPRNIELKARVPDWNAAVAAASALEASDAFLERQRDAYFAVPAGRLKLRRRWRSGRLRDPLRLPANPFEPALWDEPLRAELIQYERPDALGVRGSDYQLLPLDPGTGIEEVLSLALTSDAVVDKVRAVRIHDRVRIHLDTVLGLGRFLEFEAYVDEHCDDDAAAAKVARLRATFGVRPEDVLAGSYRELSRTAAG